MGDKPTNTQPSAGKPSKPTMAQMPDHLELGNAKPSVTKPTVSQKPTKINLGESKGQK